VVYTDIARDGMLTGPNLPVLQQMTKTGLAVIASGGISSLHDLRAIAAVPGVEGAIVGMALYTGAIDLAQAIREMDNK
jgi:phosphoribosylformimino-5-aminoimidazole carboxamide ribonucleotide (ProFAR) isomerase